MRPNANFTEKLKKNPETKVASINLNGTLKTGVSARIVRNYANKAKNKFLKYAVIGVSSDLTHIN